MLRSSPLLVAILLAFLNFFHVSNSQILESPCPRLFIYEQRNETDKWYGVVTLISDSELSGIWLRLILDRPSLQLGNWFGEVVTEDNKEYLIKNRNHKLPVNTPYPLRFYIKYDPSQPIPRLAAFRLNAKTVCPEGGVTTTPPTTSGQLITSNTLASGGSSGTTPVPPSSGSFGGNPNPPQTAPGGGARPVQGFIERPSISQGNFADDDFFPNDFNYRPAFLDNVECGSVAPRLKNKRQVYYYDGDTGMQYTSTNVPNNIFYNGNRNFYDYITSIINGLATRDQSPPRQQVAAQPLILYGEKTSIGQFPWHAALYHSRGVGLQYVCGGSLVSRYHILTAAHCVTGLRSGQTLHPDNMLVYLGKYYLKRWGSPGVQNHQVEKIIRHPRYNGKMYQNDIAVLKLASAAEFTDYVRPVCLWNDIQGNNNNDASDITPLIGKLGTVVGWGYDENGKLTEELIKLQMPIISKETCIYSFPDFYVRYTTSETFCAGFTNGSTVCNGDSGGGMVFSDVNSSNQRKIYRLRGIVSLSVALQNEFKCNPKHYVVFTDVAKYISFVRNAMQL